MTSFLNKRILLLELDIFFDIHYQIKMAYRPISPLELAENHDVFRGNK